jgi:aminoglycoside phosphotransferase (APT) family kinase protein
MARKEAVSDQLLAAIREVADDLSLEWDFSPRPSGRGYWADVYRIQFKDGESLASDGLDGELIVKVMPDVDMAKREIVTHEYVASQGFPTPLVRLSSLPRRSFDRAWVLMDFVRGTQLLSDVDMGSLVFALPYRAWITPNVLASLMAALHRIDPTPIAKELGPAGVVGSGLEWLYSDSSRLGSTWLMQRGAQLVATRPPFRRSVICHGDLHPLNVIRTSHGDVLLDWADAQYDDPLYDVAMTHLLLKYFPADAGRLVQPATRALGRRCARKFLARYERESGEPIDPERLAWFTRLAALRIFVSIEARVRIGRFTSETNHPYLRFAPVLLDELGWPKKSAPGFTGH